MATVGLSTRSITRLNGSVTPLDSSPSRSSMSGSNLEKRSVTWLGGQALKRVDQLADGLNFRLHVHADDDIEFVFDIGDEIEHREAVPLELLGEAGGFGDGHS